MEQLEEKQPFDVIVIGAGAAGMMAAGTAARSGRRVLLIEKMEKSGRKVRITGKGRCNVTNARPAEEFADQVRTNAEFFKVAFSEFNNRAAIKFFERAGVKLDIERGDRVFPQSGKAWDIANALLEFCVENGVKIIYNTRVTEILTLGDRVFGVKYINRRGFERKEECAQVILATGGVSYPATGSTGDGYAFAADLGHTIEPLRPSLTPLLSSHAQMRYLDKVLLRNVRATLYVDNEPVREEFGEIGFSDRGIEGAVALRMSRDAVDALIEEKRVKLVLDLKPALTEEVLHERIAREIAELRLWLANDASRPVAVASYRRSCGCTTLEFDAQPIAPGDARQVTLTFDSRGERGWQLKALDITLAGGQRPLRLFVEADIK